MLNLKKTETLKFVQKPAEHLDGSSNQSHSKFHHNSIAELSSIGFILCASTHLNPNLQCSKENNYVAVAD